MKTGQFKNIGWAGDMFAQKIKIPAFSKIQNFENLANSIAKIFIFLSYYYVKICKFG